jgi:hypothetical protein
LHASDCHGQSVDVNATTASDGSFTLDGVPAGMWTINAVAGAFNQSYMVDVMDGQTTTIPDNQLCLMQPVHVAVVTGRGDKIEMMLTNLGIMFDTYDGTSTGYMGSAAPFLQDPNKLKSYDLIFIDCAAADSMGSVELGPSASQIEQNLATYVMNGGSLYASDWALAILALAFPTQFQPQLMGGGTVADPFATNQLSGYAPQTVSAQVVDQNLANAIMKTTVSITFPDMTGARSNHWGLLSTPTPSGARVLVQGQVTTCDPNQMYCDSRSTPGPAVMAPLAIAYKLTPAGSHGGNIYFTGFHNIAQQGNDVADILKYIVFHL